MKALELNRFKLNAFYPNAPVIKRSAETGGEQMGMFDWMDARVPGSIYADLLRAGLIPDPYRDMNSLACEWVPARWWQYVGRFALPLRRGRHYRLNLQGIDYKAHVCLNGELLGCHEGMYVPFKAVVDGLLRENEENVLDITLENAPFEHGQLGYTCESNTQKARFTYKWDFCVRMIGMGLYRPVVVEEFGPAAVEYADIRQSFPDTDTCVLRVDAELTGFEEAPAVLECAVFRDGREIDRVRRDIAVKPGTGRETAELTVKNPALWWPNGHGDQPLYEVEISVLSPGGEISDTRRFTTGIRRIEHIRCDGCGEESLPYSLVVNGKRIYIKGVNMVPLDMNYGCVTPERYERLLASVKEANVNIIRIWGGGLIEDEAFYECCDRMGLLIWQEFIQSSSGLNNTPSKRPHFLKLLEATAAEAVKTRRTHPSLTVWSGGNELCDEQGVPSTFEDENIAMLRRIVEENDCRYMLPTSASGPHEFLTVEDAGNNHDVHGPWKYGGQIGHYAMYNRSDSQLHSEFGVDGMTNLPVLEKTVSPAHNRVMSMGENVIWRHRGEWWDTYDRDTALFGPFGEEELESFVLCSQYIQGEGLRYALEANRRRAFRNCGSIIWQFNEPFPGVAGTNLVDYYGQPKFAWYCVRDAFRSRTPSMTYDKLLWEVGETLCSRVFVANDGEAFRARVEVAAADWEGNVLLRETFEADIPAGGGAEAGAFSVAIPASQALVVTLTLTGCGEPVKTQYQLFVRNAQGFADRAVAVSRVLAVKGRA